MPDPSVTWFRGGSENAAGQKKLLGGFWTWALEHGEVPAWTGVFIALFYPNALRTPANAGSKVLLNAFTAA